MSTASCRTCGALVEGWHLPAHMAREHGAPRYAVHGEGTGAGGDTLVFDVVTRQIVARAATYLTAERIANLLNAAS